MPAEITRTPDGRFFYVANMDSGTVSVVNAATNRSTLTVTATFNLGFLPGMAQLGPDGHLWVTDSDNGWVVLFSLDTRPRHQIRTGAGAHAVVFSRDGRTGFITNQTAGTVSVIDVGSRTVVRTLRVGTKPNGMVFRPAG